MRKKDRKRKGAQAESNQSIITIQKSLAEYFISER